jgi:hypothetical protein
MRTGKFNSIEWAHIDTLGQTFLNEGHRMRVGVPSMLEILSFSKKISFPSESRDFVEIKCSTHYVHCIGDCPLAFYATCANHVMGRQFAKGTHQRVCASNNVLSC